MLVRHSANLGVSYRAFTTCYNSIMSTNCATIPDGGPHTTCACSTASAMFSCYTNACTSDKYYSSYYAGVSICQGWGIGGGAPPGPTPTGDGATGTGAGTTPTAAGATAAATGAGKNAAGITRPSGWPAEGIWVVLMGLGLWFGGMGVVLL